VSLSRARFPGLDSLRFWAALLVILDHVPITQESRGLPHPTFGALSFRGAPAVSFFFALSGFLITYLLLDERERRGDIDGRRSTSVVRYESTLYTDAGWGCFHKASSSHRHRLSAQPVWLAIGLYLGFLPALFNSLYNVGGLLNLCGHRNRGAVLPVLGADDCAVTRALGLMCGASSVRSALSVVNGSTCRPRAPQSSSDGSSSTSWLPEAGSPLVAPQFGSPADRAFRSPRAQGPRLARGLHRCGAAAWRRNGGSRGALRLGSASCLQPAPPPSDRQPGHGWLSCISYGSACFICSQCAA
jgi:hypothetical protein